MTPDPTSWITKLSPLVDQLQAGLDKEMPHPSIGECSLAPPRLVKRQPNLAVILINLKCASCERIIYGWATFARFEVESVLRLDGKLMPLKLLLRYRVLDVFGEADEKLRGCKHSIKKRTKARK